MSKKILLIVLFVIISLEFFTREFILITVLKRWNDSSGLLFFEYMGRKQTYRDDGCPMEYIK